MKNLFIIEHSVNVDSDGTTTISLYRVQLLRKSKKTYSIHHYKEEGWIKISPDKSISHQVNDLLTLRNLNMIYLKESTVVVTPELVNELILQVQQVDRD